MSPKYIESLIIKLCKQPRTFEFISKNLFGYDPIIISELIKKLEKKNILQKESDLYSIKEKKKHPVLTLSTENSRLYLKKHMGYFDFLKTPHPLDFEWRNSTDSLHFMIDEIQKINSINDKILLLGMPTLFAMVCTKDLPQKVDLIERNKPIVQGLSSLIIDSNRFKIFEENIFEVSPQNIGKYHCVIMDPPWYSPFFYQFMWLGSQCVEIGGVIGISLPPINTRPSIDTERVKWFSFCQKNGLCIESISPQKLHYAMPFFEFNAFRAAGITDISPFWRKGDLAFFRKTRLSKSKRPKFADCSNWIEREINSIRIRIKKINESVQIDKSAIFFQNIIKGDILPTVSTRDPRREKANIWTSGNRIFYTNKPLLFLQYIDNKNSVHSLKERNVISEFIQTITDFEEKEYNNYLDWLYHEMERQSD